MTIGREPTVVLFDWTYLLEDYLDRIGVSFDRFLEEMTGGWMFGYIDALRTAGIEAVLYCVSDRVDEPTRFRHQPTRAAVVLLPAPAAHRAIRKRVPNPYAEDVEAAVGAVVPRARRGTLGVLKELAPYTATPIRAFTREMRRDEARAVLCQEYENPRFDLCVGVGRVLGVPTFATFQGGNWQAGELERVVRPLTLRACGGLIAGSTPEIDRVRSRYGVAADKIARIFNPIDISEWRPFERDAARAELGLPDDARVAVWHGRVEIHRKGLDVLLDAWQRLRATRSRRDLRLHLVGTGGDADALRRRLESGAFNGVTWIDEFVLDRVAIRRYLSAANVYTLPSRHEGFPVAPIEAMACGVPVVAADAPGVADILEGEEAAGGLVVPREDASQLSEALGRLVDDPGFSDALGRRARERVESAFSLEAVGAQLRAFMARRGAALETRSIPSR